MVVLPRSIVWFEGLVSVIVIVMLVVPPLLETFELEEVLSIP
jgi:hypothetical protein